LEPHRAKWTDAKSKGGDIHGWDYFDYEACPDSEIYPCSDDEQLVYHKELYALKTPPPIQTSDAALMKLLSSPGNMAASSPTNKWDAWDALMKEASNKNNIKKRLPIPAMSNVASQVELLSPRSNTTASLPKNKRDVLLLDALVKESRNDNNVKKQLPIRTTNSSEMELSPPSLPGNTTAFSPRTESEFVDRLRQARTSSPNV
jgi:hypothetical protein